MIVLLLSQAAMGNTPLAYGMLLFATACLGIGFGLTVPSLNTFVADFFPRTIERAVLMLNAADGAQVHQPGAIREGLVYVCRQAKGQPRLAHPAWPDKSDQACLGEQSTNAC